MKCKYISKNLQLSENNFIFVLQIDTTVFRIEMYFKYEQKKERKCETLCYVADMTKRSGYPLS